MENKITTPKTRKKRKPMTAEQKVAASERLEKARAARVAKNPDYGMSSIHESLRDLPDNSPAHPNKVKVWIKTQSELASGERAQVKQNIVEVITTLALNPVREDFEKIETKIVFSTMINKPIIC